MKKTNSKMNKVWLWLKDLFRSDAKKSIAREWTESLIIAGIIAIFLRTFFFQIYKIPTTSMVATLMPGDKIFVSRVTYGPKIPFTKIRLPGMRQPERAEVVVFYPPHEPRKAYIKRLIGLPGEKILIKNGNVYVNDKIIADPRIAHNYYYNQGKFVIKELTVPSDQYFFLGDNSIASQDSRFWGFVDTEEIVGKAVFIWWPPKRIGMIE